MNQEFINLRDQQVLSEIKEYLEKISVAATMLEASENLPVNMVIAVTTEHVSINMIFLPIPEDQFEEIRLMQFYSLLAEKATEEHRNDLLKLLNAVNEHNPFGSFLVNENSEVVYKYIIPMDRFQIPKETAFQETFTLFNSTLMKFRPVILGLNSGELSLKQALSGLVE